MYNLFDWLGILLILVLIPLRYAKVDEQWSVAAIGYLANCLRVFKFSCVTRCVYQDVHIKVCIPWKVTARSQDMGFLFFRVYSFYST